MLEVNPAGVRRHFELSHEQIQLFDFQRAKINTFGFKVVMERSQNPSCSLNRAFRDCSDLFKIAKVLLINVGQLDLVVRDL